MRQRDLYWGIIPHLWHSDKLGRAQRSNPSCRERTKTQVETTTRQRGLRWLGGDQVLAQFDEAAGAHHGLVGHAIQPTNGGEALAGLPNMDDLRRGGQCVLRGLQLLLATFRRAGAGSPPQAGTQPRSPSRGSGESIRALVLSRS